MKIKAAWIEEWRKRILDCNCFYEGQYEEINHLCDLALKGIAPEEAAITGAKSRALYQPARSIAQDGKEHLYVFHRGLWYHFTPEGWKPPVSPTPQSRPSQEGAMTPTKEQIEKYIKAADLELGPESEDEWVAWCRQALRAAFDAARPQKREE